MDCCLRTRASNEVRNEVDYLGGNVSNEDVLSVELHSSQCLSCRILQDI